MEKTFVFLGPSLSLAEAKKIAPQAYYLPPVKCGDVLRILRLQPTKIVIIDGYFENTAAVWHKEILFALEKGVTVMGGSSMGALRASELHSFGMIGVGEIFEQYKSNMIMDDDEVALLHGPAEFGYVVSTDAMVNIRATLKAAVEKKIIEQSLAELIQTFSKNQFYQERKLENSLRLAEKASDSKKQLEEFRDWLKKGGYVDLKKQDAILALHKAIEKNQIPVKQFLKVERSAFFRSLHKNIMCRPFPEYYDWLPTDEKVAFAARSLGGNYRLIRRLAYLLSACYGLVEKSERESSLNFEARMGKINLLITQEKKRNDIPTTVQDYLSYLILLSKSPIANELMECVAQYWWLIDRHTQRLGLKVNMLAIQEYSDKFRLKRGLYTQESTQEWFASNGLNTEKYQTFLGAVTRLNFLVLQNNLDVLNIFENDENIWWFLDALRLSGDYARIESILTSGAPMETGKIEIDQLPV